MLILYIMIQSFEIKDNLKLPVGYASGVFENGTKFVFKPGVNIVIGENGCGKSTLLKLMKSYLLCSTTQESEYNGFNLPYCLDNFLDGGVLKADYVIKAFNLRMPDECSNDDKLKDFASFQRTFTDVHSSTGEQTLNASNFLFERMFNQKADNKFPVNIIKERKPEFFDYMKTNQVMPGKPQVTAFMDEPDRNLSLQNIKQIYNVLSYKRNDIQLIAVIHNPLLINKLANLDYINIIEMSPKYLYKVRQFIKDFS